ncbi:hypothetical protein BX666DRAFT_1849557 [Dichotomocladium elegans]|nr:hypothetical protein BX666DRAFT_1849557 [Dichotomocladium elegans]
MYRNLIKSHAKHFYNPNRRRAAEKMLKDMVNHGQDPTIDIYLQLLMGKAIHGPRHEPLGPWLDLYLALEKGKKRTIHRVKKLVNLLASRGHPGMLVVLRQAHEELGLVYKPDLETWDMAIRGSAMAGDMVTAQLLFDTMDRHHQTATTFHTLLRGYLRQSEIDHAIRVFRLMLERDIPLDQTVYEQFILAYAHPKSSHTSNNDDNCMDSDESEDIHLRIETLKRLWRTLLAESHLVPEHVLTAMLSYYNTQGAYAEAEQLYWDLRQIKSPISRRNQGLFFETIMAFAGRQQMLSALSLVYDMLSQGYWPSSKVTNKIIKMAAARDDLQLAEQLVKILEEFPDRRVSLSCYANIEKKYKKKKS